MRGKFQKGTRRLLRDSEGTRLVPENRICASWLTLLDVLERNCRLALTDCPDLTKLGVPTASP